ncbi:MAG: extracellular solute-binding protein [Defluviitaleaceae bacterium]|nr:extracellular solute-binding protein [Defluviitaleaceae bacterium]
MREILASSKFRTVVAVLIIAGLLFHLFTRDPDLVLRSRPDGGIVAAPIVLREGSHAAFLYEHALTPRGTQAIEVDIFNPSGGENFSVLSNFEGAAQVLRTEEISYVEFTVNVPASGMYNVNIEYFPVASRGIPIAREFRINGDVQFIGADHLVFSRVWGSAGQHRIDTRGNEIRSSQVELPRWETAYFRDRLGFFTAPYQFYLQAGANTLTLTGVSEPLVISRMTVVPVRDLPTFEQFMAETNLPPAPGDFYLRLQGQDSTVRSSPSLFPIFDTSSGITYPPSVATIRLNMMGGHAWRIPGQWIEWEVGVPADGLYRLSISARQNYSRGFVSSRTLMVNGEIPFQEVEIVKFPFNNGWELTTFQDDNGEYLLFPLNAGVNTIRMEVALGELGEILDRIHASVLRQDDIYRQILVLTGPSPDPQRDYRIQHFLPHVMDLIYEEVGILYGILRDLEEFTGGRNQHSGMLSTTVRQLDTFFVRPYMIPRQLNNWRQNISAMGDTARLLTEAHLDIDFFIVSGADVALPRVGETFFTRASHETRAFVASFTHDFDIVGDEHEDGITVWVPTGRDQAAIIKAMIDDTFVPEFGIGVNMRHVMPGAILPAVVAGIGPDVAISLGHAAPIDFALRNAVVDLSQFEGFDEVYTRFHESAMVPFEFMGAYFGIPENQGFSVMFYRTDILEQLDIEPPNTWDDVMAIMPILQRNNMSIGIPPIGDPMAPDLGGFLVQLYQRGGFLYNDDHSRAILDSEESIAAFDAFTRFFTHFGSLQFFNFMNRFRSGEMPIAFVDFGNFNALSVFAPEIAGLWNFGLMPGYIEPDGTINRTISSWGSSSVIFAQSEMQEEAWQFLKWWTSAETQVRFGRELESLMGEAARLPTANIEAFQSLPWRPAELEILNEQRNWILGTPEVPGGYYVGRHLVNAIRRVVNTNVDTRETLLDFNIVINNELINKRREFGLE